MRKGMDSFQEGGNNPLDIALIYQSENALIDYLKENKSINIIESKDPEYDLEESNIKAIIKISKDFDEKIENNNMGDLEILYDNSSQQSNIARDRIIGILNDFSDKIAEQRLNELGIKPEILNVVDIKSTGLSKGSGEGLMLISMLLPMMLSIWAASGGIAAATDLGAGEKERQTLEPLLTTNISRTSLFLGKYLTIVILGIMGTSAALVGYFISTKVNPNLVGGGITISLLSVVIISLFCIGLTMAFSAIEFAISVYARNFKEAQTYLAPITIIAMIPAYATMFLDSRGIATIYFHIPIVNTIAIIKESLVNVFNPGHLLIVTVWTLVYVSLAMIVTVRMFNKESVIFRN